MEIIATVFAGIGALGVLVAWILQMRQASRERGQQDTWRAGVDSDLAKLFKQSGEHYKHADDDQKHFQDTEMHWNSRERDALSETLREMSADIKELLRQNKAKA